MSSLNGFQVSMHLGGLWFFLTRPRLFPGSTSRIFSSVSTQPETTIIGEKKYLEMGPSRNLSKKPDWANPRKKRDWKQNLLKWMFYERLEVPLPLVAGIRNRYLTAESEISDEIPVPRIIFCFSFRTFSGLYPRSLDKCTSLISLYHGSDDFCAWD